MKKVAKTSEREPTIALINVVFLMLVFFLIAGTVAPAVSKDITLVKTSELDPARPPEGLVILPDGQLQASGVTYQTADSFVASLDVQSREEVRLIPDRELPAQTLLRIAAALRSAGVENVIVAAERALQ